MVLLRANSPLTPLLHPLFQIQSFPLDLKIGALDFLMVAVSVGVGQQAMDGFVIHLTSIGTEV